MTVNVTGTESTRAGDIRSSVAHRIASEVRHAERRGEKRAAKVTSLLHAFGASGSPAAMNSVIRALDESGLNVDCGWTLVTGAPDIRRTGVLTLSVAKTPAQDPAQGVGDPTIQMTTWRPGEADRVERCLPAFRTPDTDDVNWFTIDPLTVSSSRTPTKRSHDQKATHSDDHEVKQAALETRVRHVTNQLHEWCPGLSEDMVRDLLCQDVQPKVETYGDESDAIRGVSAVAVIAREARGKSDDSDGVHEQMIFQMVETIVGPSWVVSCWHRSRVFTGAGEESSGDPLLREPFLGHVAERWLNDASSATNGKKTSGDLGIYLVRSLVETYSASHRMMEQWVAAWESDFYKSLNCSEKAQRLKEAAAELSNLLSMSGEFRRRLKAFEHARETTADKSWFPCLSDRDETVEERWKQSEQGKRLSTAVAASAASFAALDHDIRADMDLLMLHSQATQQEATERMQGYLGKVTGLVLVPTFIAGLFGANTALPGGGHWMGFDLMLVLMVVSSIVVYLAIRRIDN